VPSWRPHTYPRQSSAPTLLALALFIIPLLSLLFGSTARADYDRWYSLSMQEHHAGWVHTTQLTSADTIVSTAEHRLELRRGKELLVITESVEFVETIRGEPVSMSVRRGLAAEPILTEFRFGPDAITVTVTSGGATNRSVRPRAAGEWLPPGAASMYIEKRLAAGARDLTYRTVDLLAGASGPEPVAFSWSVGARTTAESLGRKVEATALTPRTTDGVNADAVRLVDELGAVIEAKVTSGGIRLGLKLTTESAARSGVKAPELFASLTVPLASPVPRARTSTRAVYLLTASPTWTGAASVASTSVQTVERAGERAWRVTVDLNAPAAALDADEALIAECSRPSVLVSSEDDGVKALAAKATAGAGGRSALQRAELLRRAVWRHMKGSTLGVGFAAAAEVARTGSGDCTEYAVLLTAMLRADGVPSRVAAGLVYAERVETVRHVMAYHMWTQALLEVDGVRRWVDLDASLGEAASFDAAHLALTTSSLADDPDGQGGSRRGKDGGGGRGGVLDLLPMIGGVSVQIESIN